ncbi:MAG: prephenate dehydrogenase [Eubacteriales bacterium]|nr:prephenate dehydrogenase [Eubacteriales bacterium]
MEDPFFQRAAIIGTGLMGGSLGMALIERRLVGEVVGYDRDPAVMAEAVAAGAIHRSAPSPVEAVKEADLVIIAVPVGTVIPVLTAIAPRLETGALVTDVASTKREIMAAATRLLPPGVFFAGGHPMTGSELAGIRGADPYLYENAVYVICPGPGLPASLREKFERLVAALGARPVVVDPEAHDRAVAAVSHLPHLVAAALVTGAEDAGAEEGLIYLLAAGGFRDSTRIAGGDPGLWRDICLSNRDCILQALCSFTRRVEEVAAALEKGDGPAIEEFLRRAREGRERFPAKLKGYLPVLHEIVLSLPDRPGAIARVATLLAEAGINIDEIEILRVREGDGGSIKLGFKRERVAEEALALLQREGYRAHLRR